MRDEKQAILLTDEAPGPQYRGPGASGCLTRDDRNRLQAASRLHELFRCDMGE